MWLNYILIDPVFLKKSNTTISFENSLEKDYYYNLSDIFIRYDFLLDMIVEQCVKTHYCVVNNLICSHKLNQLVILWMDVLNSRVFTTYQQS